MLAGMCAQGGTENQTQSPLELGLCDESLVTVQQTLVHLAPVYSLAPGLPCPRNSSQFDSSDSTLVKLGLAGGQLTVAIVLLASIRSIDRLVLTLEASHPVAPLCSLPCTVPLEGTSSTPSPSFILMSRRLLFLLCLQTSGIGRGSCLNRVMLLAVQANVNLEGGNNRPGYTFRTRREGWRGRA